MSTPVHGFTSPGAELAALLIEHEASQAEADREALRAARAAERRARAEQIAELRAAADAGALGALVAGGLSVAGGALQVGAGLAQLEAAAGAVPDGGCHAPRTVRELQARAALWQAAGSAVVQLSNVAEGLGSSAASRRAADAEGARARAEDQAFRAGDAAEHARAAAQNHGRLLDQLRELEETRRAAQAAVLENLG